MKKERSKTKSERLILGLPGLCDTGKARAARRYRGLTLQQAWKKAGSYDLQSVCEALKVKPPIPCDIGCGPLCWGKLYGHTADQMRALLKGRIPAVVQKAWKAA